MNARLEAKLGMYITSNNFLENNLTQAGAIATVLGFSGAYKLALDAKIAEINRLISLVQLSTHPTTVTKSVARTAMQNATLSVAAASYAYAVDTLQTTLAEQLKPWTTISAFNKLKDNEVNNQCQTIRDWIVIIVTGDPNPLLAYGVTETYVVETLQDAIDVYDALVASPETKIEERKTLNEQLVLEFKSTDVLLNLMDGVIKHAQYGETNLGFYIGWTDARTIFDPVTVHTGIKGTVTDLLEQPLQFVEVKTTNADGSEIITKTDAEGNYTLYTPRFKDSPFTVFFTADGYQTLQITVPVYRGKKATRNAIMLPSE
jgi:hypothetical protein